jgi:hypothetical protein
MKNTILITTLSLFLSLTTKAQTPQSQTPQSQTPQSQAVTYKVYAVRFAAMQKTLPLSYWVLKAPEKDSVHIDFMVWLIKGDNGRTILVDAGFLRGIDDQKEFEPFTYTRPDSALEKLAGKLTLVDGDNKEIIPGITVYTGSRHTFNSQFAVVNTGVNKILLASDNIWVYYSLDHLIPPSEGGTWDNAAFVKSMERMKTLVSDPKYIIPGHDHQVFSRFPTITDGIVEIK